jgi:DNA polymerase
MPPKAGMDDGARQHRSAPLVSWSMSDAAEQGLKKALETELSMSRPGNLRSSWETLFEEARGCTRCDLYKHATQTVFGEGPLDAKLMFVAEQPGDLEDIEGRPFVGPAGQLFDDLLEKAGVDRKQTYVTNAVKHFKFVPRGKRRIHNKPDAGEIQACRWWLEHERELIRPPVTVALGATAARSLIGKAVTINKIRGSPIELEDGLECWVTTHPSALLRMPDRAKRQEARDLFVSEMKQIWKRAEKLAR